MTLHTSQVAFCTPEDDEFKLLLTNKSNLRWIGKADTICLGTEDNCTEISESYVFTEGGKNSINVSVQKDTTTTTAYIHLSSEEPVYVFETCYEEWTHLHETRNLLIE